MAIIIPSHILQNIVVQVGWDSVRRDANGNENGRDLSTIRSLRLTNKKICVMVSPLLFEKVTVYYSAPSHAKMMAIAYHKIYRTYVRSLGIAPKAISGPYMDRNRYQKWLSKDRRVVIGHGNSKPGVRILRPMTYLSTEEVEVHHERYTSLFKNQERLLGEAEELLNTAIGCFSCLEEIYPAACTRSTAFGTQSTKNAFVSGLWQRRACLSRFDFEHAAIILIAVARTRLINATPIDISKALSKMDTVVLDRMDPAVVKQIQSVIASSKKINFSIQSFDISGLKAFLGSGKCAKFLGAIRELESLTCSTFKMKGWKLPCPTISAVLGENTWRHLHRLELIRFQTTASLLSELLGRHTPILQELFLQHVLLSEGSWYEIYTTLQCGDLKVLRIYHLGCGKDHRKFFSKIKELQPDEMLSTPPLHTSGFRSVFSWTNV